MKTKVMKPLSTWDRNILATMFLAPSFRVAAQTWGVRALARDSTEMDSAVRCSDVTSDVCILVLFSANIIIDLPSSTHTLSSDRRYGYGPSYSMCACN